MNWLRKLFGGQQETDPEVVAALAERQARWRDPNALIHPRADFAVAHLLARKGRVADALRDLEGLGAGIPAQVARELPQCTAAEKRGMEAMARSALNGACSVVVARRSAAEGAAYSLIGHAWSIVGMVLQRDRAAEVRHARAAARWAKLTGHHLPTGTVEWAEAFVLKTEADAARFSAEVWERLGLPARDRPRI